MKATDYIRKSNAFNSSPWIKSLILEVLNDKLTDQSLENAIASLSSVEIAVAAVESDNIESMVDPLSKQMKQIKSIDKMNNIGLIEMNTGITLNDGLNIFYGKNGAGKSSAYTALCKVLGFNDKQVFPNLYSSSAESSCQITYLDGNGQEIQLIWRNTEPMDTVNVMIFDNYISNFIVEQDQVNNFDLVHLQSEYFVYIRNMFTQLEAGLQAHIRHNELIESQQLLFFEEKVPFIEKSGLTRDAVITHRYSSEQVNELEQIEKQLLFLQQITSKEGIRNIEYVITTIKTILGFLGTQGDDGKWQLTYDDRYFQKASEQIQEYNAAKGAFEQSDISIDLIPQGWIRNQVWNSFISSSLQFIASLEVEDQQKYGEETCVYCLQSLQSERSKLLISKYHELKREHTNKIKTVDDLLNGNIGSLEKSIQGISNNSMSIETIELEFEKIGRAGQKCLSQIEVIQMLSGIKMNMINRTVCDAYGQEQINDYWTYYEILLVDFESVLTKQKESNESRQQQVDAFSKPREILKQSRDIHIYKQQILLYFDTVDNLKQLRAKLEELVNAKRSLAQLKTKFTNEEGLQTFENLLKEEYRNFNFSPPSVWRIRSSTKGDINKRIYSLNDRKLSQIFSEGERKIHALADFFARCEFNQFKGVFIFDDPVNSLDEDKMEYVTRRILRLVEEGNQVLIFTHNLVFLNMLIDPLRDKLNKISRLASQIHIEIDVSLDNTSSMRDKFDTISERMNEFSRSINAQIPVLSLRNVYDLMSGYLEDYVEQKLIKGVITRYRPNIRMHSISSLKSINESFVDALIELYEQTSRKGSRHSQPIGSPAPDYNGLLEHVRLLTERFHYSR